MTTPDVRAMWTASDLLAAEFPEPRWAVPGIIPEGLTLLAGPPKVGKSWLSLGLAVSITTGGRALGAVDVEPGRALYLALEDTPRRLRSRLETVLTTSDAPAGLAFAVHWPAMPDGGAEKLHGMLTEHPDIRLVVVDVLAKVRGGVDTRGSMYDADYAAMGHLKAVADAHSVAVVVVHHVRKSGSDDFLETVSGTNGLAGASDTIAVLRRSRNTADAVLHITGRDVEEAEHALKFDPSCGAWSLLDGPAADYDLSDTRRAVTQYLRGASRPMRPAEIAEGLGLSADNVRQVCSRMARKAQLVAQDGRYAIADNIAPLSLLDKETAA
ncbi:MAG: AAA family ATPase [Stackebrandtia sp.]